MFRKPAPSPSPKAPELDISTIPAEFYGGANPEIKFRATGKTVVVENSQPAPVKAVPNVPKTTITATTTPGLFANQKFLVLSALGLFVVFAGGAGVYYWMVTSQPAPKIVPPIKHPIATTTDPGNYVTTTPSDPTPVTTTTPTPSSTVLKGGAIEFPSSLLGNTGDLDHDGLTDAEEEVFHSDPAVPDSDADGYDDGTEIYNLYSPTNYAPTRLITNGTVKDYTNPAFNYKLYYPANWAVGNVDESYKDVLFSTLTGESIEVRVFDRDPGQSFDDWFGVWAPGERLGALTNFGTVFKETGIARNDNLVFYFTDETHVYVIVYHVEGSDKVNYREVITMMARSFRTPANTKTITDLKVYGKPDGTSTSTPTEQIEYPPKR